MKRIAFVILLLCAAGCVTNKLQRSRLTSYNPPIPPGVCTNCPPGDTNQYYMKGMSTNKFLVGGGLAIWQTVISSNQVYLTVTNTIPKVDYTLQSFYQLTNHFDVMTQTASNNFMVMYSGVTNFYQFFRIFQEGLIITNTETFTNSVGTNCIGNHSGYVRYALGATNGWGWVIDTNAPFHGAKDITRTDTAVVYLSDFGETGCGIGMVFPNQTGPRDIFAVYFPTNVAVPTNPYPLYLRGYKLP